MPRHVLVKLLNSKNKWKLDKFAVTMKQSRFVSVFTVVVIKARHSGGKKSTD